jgi:hypothetical protein
MHRLTARGVAVILVALVATAVLPISSVSAATPNKDTRAHQLMTVLAKAPSLDDAMAKLTPADRDLAIQAITPVTRKTTITFDNGSTRSSLGFVSAAVVGSGCWNWGWINNSWYNSLGWETFRYSNKFYWCSNGSILTSNVSRWETGSVYVVCWSYVGVNTHYTNGGSGSSWYESYSQGHFKCTTVWVDIQNAYPAIDATIYAHGNPTYELL